MRINAHTARTSQAAPHHAISPLYSPPRGSIAAIVLRLEILFGIEGRRRREFSEQDEMVLRVAFTTKERPLWYTTKPPMLFLWYFLPQTICVISGTHVVIHNWSFVILLWWMRDRKVYYKTTTKRGKNGSVVDVLRPL